MGDGLDARERSALAALDALLCARTVKEKLEELAQQVEEVLLQDEQRSMAWRTVPLSVYSGRLPDDVRSSWVFALRAGATTGAERHPNSRQRMMSYRGSGDLQIRALDGEWANHMLIDEPGAPLEQRWVSIRENAWHQAVVGDDNWIVLSFHTVAAHDLVEERQDISDRTQVIRRKYLK